MKHLFYLTGLATILTASGAMAEMPKIFVGANIGYANTSFDNDSKSYIEGNTFSVSEDAVAFGLEAGAKFKTPFEFYSAGFTLGYNFLNNFESDWSYLTDKETIEITMYALSATFDNYLTVTKGNDIVLGIGYGNVAQRFEYSGYAMSPIDETDHNSAVVGKVGYIGSLSEHFDFTATATMYFLLDDKFDLGVKKDIKMENPFDIKVGVRYNF